MKLREEVAFTGIVILIIIVLIKDACTLPMFALAAVKDGRSLRVNAKN